VPNLSALAAVLRSGDARVVTSEVHPLADAAKAVSHMLGHHATGQVAITV
jgi:NADPH:quinone reductase-like Zn-dependent oxidoreductase